VFLGTFAKLRKATIGFVMPVRPSAWENSAPTGWIFLKFDTWVFFENLSRKLQSDKNNAYSTWQPLYIFDHILLISSWNEKSFRQKL